MGRNARLGALFLGLIAAFTLVLADNEPCTAHADGNIFDLSPLKATKDYEFKSDSGRDFVLNVCQKIAHETWNLKVDKPDDVGGFARGGHGDISLGTVTTDVLVRNGNPLILMSNGSACPKSENLHTTTAIRFICDSSASTGSPQLITQLPPQDETACSYVIEWRTSYACPTSDRSIFVSILYLLLTAAGLVVFIFSSFALYNKFFKNRDGLGGLEIPGLPSSGILDHIRDCMGTLLHRDPWTSAAPPARRWGRNNWSSRAASGFERVPSSREESEAMMGDERYSLEDEDDDPELARTATANGHGGGPPRAGIDNAGVIRL